MDEEIKKYIDSQYKFMLDSLRSKHLAIDKSLHELQNKINIGREYTLLLIRETAEKIMKEVMREQEKSVKDRVDKLYNRIWEMESLDTLFKNFKDEFKEAKKFFDKLHEAYSEFGHKFCDEYHE